MYGKPRKGRPLHDHAAHEYLAFDPPAPETPDEADLPIKKPKRARGKK